MSIRKRALSLLLVLVMLLGVLPAGAAAAEVYQDVPSGHWASDYIARVAEQGLMVGTSDTTFAPEETITRGHVRNDPGALCQGRNGQQC